MITLLGTLVACTGAAILGDWTGARLWDWWHVG